MAERRMFARSVVTSDFFRDMPAEAQALYLQLCMEADDDGFVDNPRSIMRGCGASDDSMKLLVAKAFVLTFNKGDQFLLVIKHWRVNNYIQKDRYRKTKYAELMRELYYDENRSYSKNPGDGHTPCLEASAPEKPTVSILDTTCIQPVSKMDTQYRDSIEIEQSKSEVGKEGCGEKNPNRSLTAYGVYQNVLLDLGVMESLEDEFGMSYAGLAMQQLSTDLHQGKTIRHSDDHEAELRERLAERRRR